ncbi:MAG: hypothetical protein ACRD0J_02895, partial [Acidimicrobiales bacterium]
GLERSLHTPAHFRRFVGSDVAVKAKPGAAGDRRLQGRLIAADEGGIVISGNGLGADRRVAYADIERARTVFDWGSTARDRPARPGRARRNSAKTKPSKNEATSP